MARLGAASASAGAAPVQPGLLTSELRARLLVGALAATSSVTGVLPRRSVGRRLCRIAGTMWYLTAPAAREAVEDNLRHILGHAPPRSMVREVFVHGALNYWDTLALPHLSREQLLSRVHVGGLEHIDAALAEGRGVILAGAHLGSVAHVGQVLPASGYPIVGVVEPIEPPLLFDFFVRQRQRFGARLLPAGASSVRELLAALRRNELLALIADRDVSGSGPFVQFFDAPARFTDGPAALAIRTGAAVLTAVSLHLPDGRLEGFISPPLEMPATSDRRQDVVALTQTIAKGLEYHIANHPEQWTVFQKRWPAGPGGSE